MKQKDALGALLGQLGENGGGLGGMVSDTQPAAMRQQERPAAADMAELTKPDKGGTRKSVLRKPTARQIKAVEQAQNSQRGRGRSKGERVMIAFKTPVDIVEQIENIHYETGITKNDLYQEALEDLIRKYSKGY